MSDDWRFFICHMGDNLASIMVDVGISSTIERAPPDVAVLALTYKSPDHRGLPTNEEFAAVSAVEDQLKAFVDLSKDAFVGRITKEGERIFFIYTSRNAARWEKFRKQLSERSGYVFTLSVSPDPEHQEYWKYLYPTPDDWQVISDMSVVEAMKKSGDDKDAEHKIEHFTYFPDEASARKFIDWAVSDRFKHDPEQSGQRDGKYCVFLYHLGVTHQTDVSNHTIALRRKAEELGGEYDGWGAAVVTANE